MTPLSGGPVEVGEVLLVYILITIFYVFFSFDVDHFCKVFIEFFTILLLFYGCCCVFFGPKACGILAARPGIKLISFAKS